MAYKNWHLPTSNFKLQKSVIYRKEISCKNLWNTWKKTKQNKQNLHLKRIVDKINIRAAAKFYTWTKFELTGWQEHLKSCRTIGQDKPLNSQNVSAEEEKSSMDEDKEVNAIVSNPEEKREKEKRPRDN